MKEKIRVRFQGPRTVGTLIVNTISEAVAFAREFIRSGGSAIIYTRNKNQ